MHIASIPAGVTFAVVTAVVALALWKGGPEERLIAVLQQLALINSVIVVDRANREVHLLLAAGFGSLVSDGMSAAAFRALHPLPGELLSLVTFAVCVACALRSRSYWTLWAAAGYLLALVTHLVLILRPETGLTGYLSAQLVWTYVTTFALFCGVAAPRLTEAIRRRR